MVSDGTEGDLAYSYLRAIQSTGRSLRAIPIGAIGISDEERWEAAGGLFLEPVVAPFVNFVCAAPGLLMGTRTPLDLGREEDLPAELRIALGGQARTPRATPGMLVYQPQTAISGLLTVGCPNVAILQSRPRPGDNEIRALARYDRVICPTPADALVLNHLGVKAIYLPPRADFMGRLLEELCNESGTTATTQSSLAMDALLEITSSPFTAPEEWRSRSETSPEGSSVPSGDTPSSTSSSSPAAVGWTRWMWRSITRTLWF